MCWSEWKKSLPEHNSNGETGRNLLRSIKNIFFIVFPLSHRYTLRIQKQARAEREKSAVISIYRNASSISSITYPFMVIKMIIFASIHTLFMETVSYNSKVRENRSRNILLHSYEWIRWRENLYLLHYFYFTTFLPFRFFIPSLPPEVID